MLLSILIIWAIIVAASFSVKSCGPNNLIEKEIDSLAEKQFHLPDGTLTAIANEIGKHD